MSDMTGNPHAETATQRHELLIQATNADPQLATAQIAMLQAEATLALAYEQRTANLLHALEISLRAQGVMVTADVPAIIARLGLTA